MPKIIELIYNSYHEASEEDLSSYNLVQELWSKDGHLIVSYRPERETLDRQFVDREYLEKAANATA